MRCCPKDHGKKINEYLRINASTAMAVEYDDQKLKLLGWFVDVEVRVCDAVAAAFAFLSTGSGAFSSASFCLASARFCCTVDLIYISSLPAIAVGSLRFVHTRAHRL